MTGAMAEVVPRELEPSVERLLESHLGAARDWLTHRFVPWSTTRDFDGPLKGSARESAQSVLSRSGQDAPVYVTVRELAHHRAHRDVGASCGDRVGERLVARIAAAGVFSLDVHRAYVVGLSSCALGVMSATGPGAAGRQAQDRLGQRVEWLGAQASRARGLYERMIAGSAAGPPAARNQETQV